MDESKKKAIQKLNPKLIHELDVNQMITELRSQKILSPDHVDELKNIQTTSDRCQKFLDLIINKDNSWLYFMNALDKVHQNYLRIELETEAFGTITDQFEEKFIPQLEIYIGIEAEQIRSFWQEYLEVVELEDIYQPLEIVEIRGQNVERQFLEGYDFIWKNLKRRIFLIEGDPGVGKTTWLNKLAMGWAEKNQTLREKFDFLFLVPLSFLESSTLDGFLRFLSGIFDEKLDVREISTCLKQPKTLLLLDGFDENPSCIEFISNFTVKNGYFCKILITCRGSHADQIRRICDMRLLVKGFKEEAIYKFFELQNCGKPKEIFDSYSQLPGMCKVPMVAAILCSIFKHSETSVKLAEDENFGSLIVFENFVKMLINLATEKRSGVFNKERDKKKVMEVAGNFALSQLAKRNFDVQKLCQSVPKLDLNETGDNGKNESFNLASNLGLIYKRSKKNLDGSFAYNYGFYHQLILEYFAALKFHEELVSIQNENLFQEWFYRHYPDWADSGPFYYFLKSLNHKLFDFIVREQEWIYEAAYCLNNYSELLLLSNQKNLALFFVDWTLTGKTANNFIDAAISCKKVLSFCNCKIFALFDPKKKKSRTQNETTNLSFADFCQIDTNSLLYLLTIPTLQYVQFDSFSVEVTDVKNISKLQFSEYFFKGIVWNDQSSYNVFEALLKNKNLQQNLKETIFLYPDIENKNKFDAKLIQIFRLKKLQILNFKCFGEDDCPIFLNKNTENQLSTSLKKIKFRRGKICQHIVEFLQNMIALKHIFFIDESEFENQTVKLKCEQLKEQLLIRNCQ